MHATSAPDPVRSKPAPRRKSQTVPGLWPGHRMYDRVTGSKRLKVLPRGSDIHSVTPLKDVGAAPPRLLIIEDSPSDAMLLEAALQDSVLEAATIVHESSPAAGLETLL